MTAVDGDGREHAAPVTEGHLVAGRYRLVGVLGSGATAQVYRAVDTRLGRTVAVKVFRTGTDSPAARRLASEARLLASLRHPGLVSVYDAGTDDGRPYVVMTLVDGETLRERLARGPLAPGTCGRLGAALAGVLAHVHAAGIIHRDVKPSNVLLDRAGLPYLTDFGISRLLDSTRVTTTGMVVGTAAYMAPEQVRGELVGPEADVYALGLVLLECVTGQVEYPGTMLETAVARLSRPPRVPAGLPLPLRDVLVAMTAAAPEARPSAARCHELFGHGVHLGDAGDHGAEAPTVESAAPPPGTAALRPGPGPSALRSPRASRPWRGVAATAGVAAVVAAGLALAGAGGPAPATRDRPAAEAPLTSPATAPGGGSGARAGTAQTGVDPAGARVGGAPEAARVPGAGGGPAAAGASSGAVVTPPAASPAPSAVTPAATRDRAGPGRGGAGPKAGPRATKTRQAPGDGGGNDGGGGNDDDGGGNDGDGGGKDDRPDGGGRDGSSGEDGDGRAGR